MLSLFILVRLMSGICVLAYSNYLMNLVNTDVNISDVDCSGFTHAPPVIIIYREVALTLPTMIENTTKYGFKFSTVRAAVNKQEDPFYEFETTLNNVLFGTNDRSETADMDAESQTTETEYGNNREIDLLAHFPSGHVMRAELFQNKTGVHLPPAQWLHRGHCHLDMTKDYMQTAVNAFAIFLTGDLSDVLRLPPMYVLRSARTISMMKIAREKLVATWFVIKGNHHPEDITYETLELYRPLFKYVNGREMSKLNLKDERILSYIGTHADLDRHQVGVIASRYIKLNPNWKQPRYLNLMNNLLCGVPMNFMRNVPENTYLQLSHQLFYHVRACDPLQRRFYLAMMTRTQVLGKSNSWSARDVARLGLLMTEVDGPELSAIIPQAISGITAQVILEMSPHNLNYLTETQRRYLGHKPLNILTKRLKVYKEQMQILHSGLSITSLPFITWIVLTVIILIEV